MKKIGIFTLLGVLSLTAGDWLNRGGDAQHSGWQRRGKTIHTGNAGEIRLLWKQKLDGGELSSPVMLGPIVTHRGIKELVFVQSAAGDVYAVDADLGRVFWKRHIEGAVCEGAGTSTPAMAPAPAGSKVNEDDDEGHTPMRPFYFVAGDGELHTIRPADGADMAPPMRFVPAGANVSALTFADGHVYATTSKGCGGAADGVWGLDTTSDTTDAKAKPSFVAIDGAAGVSMNAGGAVYVASKRGIVTLASNKLVDVSTNGDAPVVFAWNGRNLLAVAGGHGDVSLVDAGKVQSRQMGAAIHGLATAVDASGTRWIYATVDRKVVALRVRSASLEQGWEASGAGSVVANGILFGLGSSVLYALDAQTGKVIYTSGATLQALANPSALAVANGHICFTSEGTMYCFGLPIEIL